jgi:hypothetical protein
VAAGLNSLKIVPKGITANFNPVDNRDNVIDKHYFKTFYKQCGYDPKTLWKPCKKPTCLAHAISEEIGIPSSDAVIKIRCSDCIIHYRSTAIEYFTFIRQIQTC